MSNNILYERVDMLMVIIHYMGILVKLYTALTRISG